MGTDLRHRYSPCMFEILSITGPIYLCIALGYFTTRQGMFAKAELRTLGKFVINLGLPALLFNALAQRNIADLMHLDYLLIYGLASVLSGLAGMYWFLRVRQAGATASAVAGMGMACSNSGFVGYPIVLLLYPEQAGMVLALNMVVENMLLIPLMLALAERGQGQAKPWHQVVRDTARSLLTNPLVIGVALGMVFSALQIQLPVPVARTISLFSLSSAALSLFVIGGSLVGLHLQGILGRVYPLALGKLILHPMLAAALAAALPLLGLAAMDPVMRTSVIISCAVPMMGIYTVLAQKFDLEEVAAASLLLVTVASFFSLNVVLWMLRLAA